MPHEPLTFATRPLSRWVNGAGRKADIDSGPGWMVGFAWLDTDAPFSDHSGQSRTITLLDGPGFTLDFAPPHHALVVRIVTEPTHLPAPPAGTIAFLVDLTTRDALRLDGTIATGNLPAAYILFTPAV